MIHRVLASVDRRALAHNFSIAKQHAGAGRVLAVIKANAYGHGLVPVAEALHEADIYGVTDVDEAERLRESGTDKDILVLQGLIERADVARCAHHGFQVVIHRREHLRWLEEELAGLSLRKPLTFWLKLDSGMGRLGIAPREYAEVFRELAGKPWTDRVVLMTHLANASLPDSPLNAAQLDSFEAVRNSLPAGAYQTSIPSSAGLLSLDCHSDWARPGIMLYGSSPFPWSDTERRRDAFGLQAVMTLQARLISVAEHAAGDNIGYNSQFICPGPMRVGIVACGYADGYPSNAPNGVPVSVRGKRTRTLGRVSMDMLAVDLTAIPEASEGDAVTLWGAEVSLDEVAAHTGILSYNLTCSIAARVPLVHR